MEMFGTHSSPIVVEILLLTQEVAVPNMSTEVDTLVCMISPFKRLSPNKVETVGLISIDNFLETIEKKNEMKKFTITQ